MRTMVRILAAASFVVLGGVTPGLAQTAATDEAVSPNGAVSQRHGFTAGQKHAIYSAAIRQKPRSAANRIPTAVGAAVPPPAELLDLPAQASAGTATAVDLKYAMVDSDVVVVDPVEMRVVDVIHGGAKP